MTDIEHESLGRIADALEKLVRLGAMQALAKTSNEEQGERVKFLLQLGFDNTEISSLLGMSPNAAKVAVHRAKKTPHRKKKLRK